MVAMTAHRTQQRIQRTRDQVIAVAWELLERRPWSEVTVADICERADVAPRTFYRYFPDKVELLFADAEAHERHAAEAVGSQPLNPDDPAAFFETLFDLFAAQVEPYGRAATHRRQELIDSDPELIARDLLKRSRIQATVADELAHKPGVDALTASVWAAVGVAVFWEGLQQWLVGSDSLREHVHRAWSAMSVLQ